MSVHSLAPRTPNPSTADVPMASKSRGSKAGNGAGPTRRTKRTKPAEETSTSPAAVAVVEAPESRPEPTIEANVEPKIEPPLDPSPGTPAIDEAAIASAVAQGMAIVADDVAALTIDTEAKPKRRAPRKKVDSEKTSAPRKRSRKATPKEAVVVTAPAAEPVEAAQADTSIVATHVVEPLVELPAADGDAADFGDDKPVELPFIIDTPREVPVDADLSVESPHGYVDAFLEPSTTPKSADEWVDQVLEPTKPSVRSSRARGASTNLTPTGVKGVAKTVAKPVAKPVAKAAAGKTEKTTVTAARVPEQRRGTRWWLVAPVFLVAAVLLYLNRPGRGHAPVPVGVLGTWTTAFWLYENQTLEIKADTVVATLDEPEEGRFPITKVETNDAGREVAVKITYRNPDGEEKVLDFLADKDPTTALRFRAHTGLVWVKPE